MEHQEAKKGMTKFLTVRRDSLVERSDRPAVPSVFAGGLVPSGAAPLAWGTPEDLVDVRQQVRLASGWYGWAITRAEPKAKPAMEEIKQVCRDIIERVERLEKAVSELSEAISSRPVVKQTLLYDLADEDYRVLEPIPTMLEEAEGEFVARIPELECFGTGDSEAESIMALKNELVHLLEDLSSTPASQLGKLPSAWLRILNRLVQKV